ncbi:hypothetical protein HUO13_16055 [Saccharopolyspora erythraea]|nr:hypothetical protein [Saccharopolyspora erythraea]QUH02107.1 hypothetical protein HUO13_16055 [Saccharopolyspora erythraea]
MTTPGEARRTTRATAIGNMAETCDHAVRGPLTTSSPTTPVPAEAGS